MARDFALPADWPNPGPTDLLELGLPDGLHEADLRALSPTEGELRKAARCSRSHDPSEGYKQVLGEVLAHMGVRDADLGN